MHIHYRIIIASLELVPICQSNLCSIKSVHPKKFSIALVPKSILLSMGTLTNRNLFKKLVQNYKEKSYI